MESSEKNFTQEKLSPLELLRERPITLVSERFDFTIENIENIAPGKKIFICDTNVKELVNEGNKFEGGYKNDGIINFDHHFDDPRFYRLDTTTTTLVIDYVKKQGPVDPEAVVVINHTDADSILSSLILRGILPPDEKFAEASIAADHTCEENPIGDLLLALQDKRDLELSLRNLELLLSGKELEDTTKELIIENVIKKREKAREIVRNGLYRTTANGRIVWIETDTKFESGYFVSLFPEAEIIVLFCPREKKPTDESSFSAIQAKVRLGIKAKPGIHISKIISQFDDRFGGRWNAGSNGRRGGLSIPPEEFIEKLAKIIEKI